VYGRDASRRCLLRKRCLPNTPLHHIYKWVSHVAMKTSESFGLFVCLFYFHSTTRYQHFGSLPRNRPRRIGTRDSAARRRPESRGRMSRWLCVAKLPERLSRRRPRSPLSAFRPQRRATAHVWLENRRSYTDYGEVSPPFDGALQTARAMH
jgi:hypothetical protein